MYHFIAYTLLCRCMWEGKSCSNDSFLPAMTDYGLCYTFNEEGKGTEQTGRTIGESIYMF